METNNLHIKMYQCDVCALLLKDLVKFILHKEEHATATEESDPGPDTPPVNRFKSSKGIVPLAELRTKETFELYLPHIKITPLETAFEEFKTKIPTRVITLDQRATFSSTSATDKAIWKSHYLETMNPSLDYEIEHESPVKNGIISIVPQSLLQSPPTSPSSEKLTQFEIESSQSSPKMSQLSDLETIHTNYNTTLPNTNSLTCYLCSQRLPCSSSLKLHLMNEHPNEIAGSDPSSLTAEGTVEKTFRCRFCTQTYANESWLLEHLQNSCYNKIVSDEAKGRSSGVVFVDGPLGSSSDTTFLIEEPAAEEFIVPDGEYQEVEMIEYVEDAQANYQFVSSGNPHGPILLQFTIPSSLDLGSAESDGVSVIQPSEDPLLPTAREQGCSGSLNIGKVPIQCPLCQKTLIGKYSFQSHMELHDTSQTTNLHSCYSCPRKFRTELKLKEHMEQNHTVRDFTCDLCEKAYANETALKVHKRRVHDGRKYVCGICKRVYASREGLRYHNKIGIHTPDNSRP